MQRAYIVKDWQGDLPQHPMPHLSGPDGVMDGGVEASKNYQGENEQQDHVIAENSFENDGVFVMTPRDEFIGLVSFLTSTAASALPPIDPSIPLDPQLILDFDHTRPAARSDMRQLELDMMGLFPVILFGKMRDPQHREIMKMLSQYKIDPPPLVVEVDQRADADYLIPTLARLLGTKQLPQVVLNGHAAGGYKAIQAAFDGKDFKELIATSGAEVTEKKTKKKAKYAKMAERAENERVLGPRPIQRALYSPLQ